MAPHPTGAQDHGESPERLIELRFTPTERAQIALWVESADGAFLQTLRLTESVALRGIGNRPGALQMNSGFRWPYGRREGVLPVWAHRRASAPGAELFPRVIFQDRASEGFASRTSSDASRDDYFCLSFNAATTRRDALDAVSCASVFNSDKGRYLEGQDVTGGYAEPWEDPEGGAMMRPLELGSLYPPRRDVTRCTSASCDDHPDVADFGAAAHRVMPGIDAVTMATPPGNEPHTVRFMVPPSWESGEYVAWLEINVEGDYNDHFNDRTYPTPDDPEGQWDVWAKTFGYPYRGQPSIVYRMPFQLSTAGGEFQDWELVGYGALHGQDGQIRDMDGRITNDPESAPGSGADRLRNRDEGPRFSVRVVATNVCSGPSAPAACGTSCSPGTACNDGLICGPDRTCVGVCDVQMPPPAVEGFVVEPHADEKLSHAFAHVRFTAPAHAREVAEYELRYDKRPILDEDDFMSAKEARVAEVGGDRLMLPTDVPPGQLVEDDFGELLPQTRYHVALRAVDACGQSGPLTTAEVTTTEVHFTTVSPCFVATAAHGSPMAADVSALRRLRDRHLGNHAVGRWLVDLYYEIGPHAADLIRDHETVRAMTRTFLSPVVALARLID